MGLCLSRSCGCALTSTDLALSGSGTSVDPWVIGFPVSNSQLPMRTFVDNGTRDAALPSPTDGQEVWISSLSQKQRRVSGAWRTIYQGLTSYTPTILNLTVGAGGTVNGQYWRSEDSVFFAGRATLGTGFSVAGLLDVSVPVTPAAGFISSRRALGIVTLANANAGQIYIGSAQFNGTGTGLQIFNPAPATFPQSSTSPFTWEAGDEIIWEIAYPAA